MNMKFIVPCVVSFGTLYRFCMQNCCQNNETPHFELNLRAKSLPKGSKFKWYFERATVSKWKTNNPKQQFKMTPERCQLCIIYGIVRIHSIVHLNFKLDVCNHRMCTIPNGIFMFAECILHQHLLTCSVQFNAVPFYQMAFRIDSTTLIFMAQR